MAESSFDIQAFVEGARATARAQRDARRAEIVAAYSELVAMPPEQQAVELEKRAKSTLDTLYEQIPDSTPDNAEKGRALMRNELAAQFGQLDDETLERIAQQVAQAIQKDIDDEVRQIRKEVVGVASHAHGKRPHLRI